MTEETKDKMVKLYTRMFVSRFKKIAERAYRDGLEDGMKFCKESTYESDSESR